MSSRFVRFLLCSPCWVWKTAVLEVNRLSFPVRLPSQAYVHHFFGEGEHYVGFLTLF